MYRIFQMLKYIVLMLALLTAYTNCGQFQTQDNGVNSTTNSVSNSDSEINGRQVVTFSYSTSNPTYWTSSKIQINSPAKSYGPGTYSILPALPVGLSLNSLTGDISGTPVIGQNPVSYKVTFTNAKYLATSNLVIQIKNPILSYSISSATYIVGQPIVPNIPKTNIESTSMTYSVTPQLPNGLHLDPMTGIISGQTTATSIRTEYIVKAESALGRAYSQLYLKSVKIGRPFQYTLRTTTLNQNYSLSLVDGYEYNFEVSWGDGTRSTITDAKDPTNKHIYQSPGVYTVTLTGLVEAWQNSCTSANIQDVIDLGEVAWSNLKYAFYNCKELKSIQGGDTSQVTDMSNMFNNATVATPDVSRWDTSKVTNMSGMFSSTKSANPDVSKWNTSNVTQMNNMFYAATAATPDVSRWDTSKVTNMSGMFAYSTAANLDVSKWDTSKVTDMGAMFIFAESVNPDVSRWDTSNVTNMSGMFSSTKSANPDVSKWNTSRVINMGAMFSGTRAANPDVSKWDTSNVIAMSHMFLDTRSANPDVSKWDTSNVIGMNSMFSYSSSATPDVSSWNVSKVTDMRYIFYLAAAAKPNIGKWAVSSLLYADYFMEKNQSLDTNTYSEFLMKTAEVASQRAQPLPKLTFNLGKSKYLQSASEAKKYLESLSWTIADGGELK